MVTGYNPRLPFRDGTYDQFDSGDCYWTEGTFDSLDDAVELARKITAEAIEYSNGYKKPGWHGRCRTGLRLYRQPGVGWRQMGQW